MEQSMTSVSNQHYDLASILYHALESSQTANKFIQDAQGDQELAQFFQQIQQQDDQRAQKALQLLQNRTSH